MAEKKLPAIQWYPGDWRKDPGVQASDYETRGIWFECCMLMHESEERGRLVLNGRPMPDVAIARLLGLTPEKWAQARATILDYGIASEDDRGALINRRMVEDERVRQARAAAGSKGGKASSKQAKPQQTASKPVSKTEAGKASNEGHSRPTGASKPEANAKQKATPSVSVSSSVSSSEGNNNPPVSSGNSTARADEAPPDGNGRLDEPGQRGKHPDTDRLWDGVMRARVLDVWHCGREAVELGDKSVKIGLEALLFSDLLWRCSDATDDPELASDMAAWLVRESRRACGWDDGEPRTLYWLLREQNFEAAQAAYLATLPSRSAEAYGVSVKTIPTKARTA